MRLPLAVTISLLAALALPACADPAQDDTEPAKLTDRAEQKPAAGGADLKTAVFAGGCFWCVEQAFDEVEGVVTTTSGYTGGELANPTYEQVSHGGTGHVEAVRLRFDPSQVGYKALLQTYWHNIDPTDPRGQFCDKGASYLSVIFAQNDKQRRLAQASKEALQNDPDAPAPIVTTIRGDTPFYPAEDYHQNYYQKNPLRYKYYKFACGRADRLEELWGEKAGKP